MDWTMCVICQNLLQNHYPALKIQPTGVIHLMFNVYKDFLENVAEFEKLNALPTQCGILSSGMSDNTIESCMVNKASWHRSCNQRFNNSKLQREKERKRKLDAEIENGNEMSDSATHRSKQQSIDSSAEKPNAFSVRRKPANFMNIAHSLLAIPLRIWH